MRDMGIGCEQGFFFGRPHAQPGQQESPTTPPRPAPARRPHRRVFPKRRARSAAHRHPGQHGVPEKMLVAPPALPAPRDQQRRARTLQHGCPNCTRWPSSRTPRRAGRADQPPRTSWTATLPYSTARAVRQAAVPAVRECVAGRDRKIHDGQANGQAARERRPALSRRWLRHHRKQQSTRGSAPAKTCVRAVTEVRIEAARYAQPADFPARQHSDQFAHCAARRQPRGFLRVLCEPEPLQALPTINTATGKATKLLKFTAAMLADVCDPTRDFLGHVGGDDF